MKLIRLLFLSFIFIGCGQGDKGPKQFNICQPLNSTNCEYVDERTFLLYQEQYQACFLSFNAFNCMNIFEF